MESTSLTCSTIYSCFTRSAVGKRDSRIWKFWFECVGSTVTCTVAEVCNQTIATINRTWLWNTRTGWCWPRRYTLYSFFFFFFFFSRINDEQFQADNVNISQMIGRVPCINDKNEINLSLWSCSVIWVQESDWSFLYQVFNYFVNLKFWRRIRRRYYYFFFFSRINDERFQADNVDISQMLGRVLIIKKKLILSLWLYNMNPGIKLINFILHKVFINRIRYRYFVFLSFFSFKN